MLKEVLLQPQPSVVCFSRQSATPSGDWPITSEAAAGGPLGDQAVGCLPSQPSYLCVRHVSSIHISSIPFQLVRGRKEEHTTLAQCWLLQPSLSCIFQGLAYNIRGREQRTKASRSLRRNLHGTGKRGGKTLIEKRKKVSCWHIYRCLD